MITQSGVMLANFHLPTQYCGALGGTDAYRKPASKASLPTSLFDQPTSPLHNSRSSLVVFSVTRLDSPNN